MNESYLAQAETFMTNQLRTLVGYTVVDAAFSKDSEMEGMLYPGLRMRNENGYEAIVWFLRDEEDNGAGHYDIQFMA